MQNKDRLAETFITDLNLASDDDYIKYLDYELKTKDILLTQDQLTKQIEFLKLLVEYNKKINLTSIVKFEDMVEKHILDSLLILKTSSFDNDMNMLDIGAGAGFPSTPIAILDKFKYIVQMDSLKKRVNFLELVKKELNLKVHPIHARAEEAAKEVKYREKFDIVTARAVSKLNILCELSIPFLKLNWIFIVLKGPKHQTELNAARNAINELGAKLDLVKEFKLKNNVIRNIILIKKISHSLTKYPRKFSKILKNPL